MLASLNHRARCFTSQRVTWCTGSFKRNAVSPQDGAAREPWQRYREALNPVLASHASHSVDLLVKLCCNRSSATLGPCLCFLPGALFRRWRWAVLLHADCNVTVRCSFLSLLRLYIIPTQAGFIAWPRRYACCRRRECRCRSSPPSPPHRPPRHARSQARRQRDDSCARNTGVRGGLGQSGARRFFFRCAAQE